MRPPTRGDARESARLPRTLVGLTRREKATILTRDLRIKNRTKVRSVIDGYERYLSHLRPKRRDGLLGELNRQLGMRRLPRDP